MSNSTDLNETFVEDLVTIGESVEKWPKWKREGWAILDLEEDDLPQHCNANGTSSSSEEKFMM